MHRALFEPSVAAGLLRAGALAGYRRQPVYLRGSRHVPPNHEVVPDAMTSLRALLSIAARYDAIGRLAARQAAAILAEGVAAGDLPVLRMEEFAFVVNMSTARSLDLFPPLELLQIAETVE